MSATNVQTRNFQDVRLHVAEAIWKYRFHERVYAVCNNAYVHVKVSFPDRSLPKAVFLEAHLCLQCLLLIGQLLKRQRCPLRLLSGLGNRHMNNIYLHVVR